MKKLLVVLALVGCSGGGGGGGTSSDLASAAKDMAMAADGGSGGCCGNPGDTGNSKGVGKYCKEQSDCDGNKSATICSKVGVETTNFCTTLCTSSDGGVPAQMMECGEGAICVCSQALGGNCGCVPAKCFPLKMGCTF